MQNGLLVHKHLIVRAEAVRPPMDEEILSSWLQDFIESINMKVLMGPYVKYHDPRLLRSAQIREYLGGKSIPQVGVLDERARARVFRAMVVDVNVEEHARLGGHGCECRELTAMLDEWRAVHAVGWRVRRRWCVARARRRARGGGAARGRVRYACVIR